MEQAAITDVVNERIRQQVAEGWTSEHDDTHTAGELARAAATYAYAASLSDHRRSNISGIFSIRNNFMAADLWPWDASWWKSTDRRRDLVKAGALILAEIERLDRIQAARPSEGTAGAAAAAGGEQPREAE
jgi:hypothetical protein